MAGEILEQVQTLQARLNELEAQLLHSHRLATLGTLASILAHEYNNILTPILSYAQLALASPQDRDLLLKAVEKARQGAERAARLSASILGFARGEEPAHPRWADVAEIVDQSLACLARDPARDGIEVIKDVGQLRLAIAPTDLQQVLVNLLLNAREAMLDDAGRRGGHIRLWARACHGRGVIEVGDTGPGILPEVLPRVFEPFVTTKHGPGEAGASEKRGTGLGLAISRDLCRRAGGDLEAFNQPPPGRGAVFRITLPLAGSD